MDMRVSGRGGGATLQPLSSSYGSPHSALATCSDQNSLGFCPWSRMPKAGCVVAREKVNFVRLYRDLQMPQMSKYYPLLLYAHPRGSSHPSLYTHLSRPFVRQPLPSHTP